VDQQGHVYISGRDSHDIHRLSPDGTFRQIVLSKHDYHMACDLSMPSCPQNKQKILNLQLK
jgi:hypothetical protein